MISQREVLLLSFPFSDGSTSRVRPVVVLSNDRYNRRSEGFVAVPLTSNPRQSSYAVPLTNDDMETGSLIVESRAKVDRVLSVRNSLVRLKVGKIKPSTHKKLVRTLLGLVE